jgi:phosphocarrier protein HPr
MIEKKVRIKNKLGLHARPAALLVKTAAKFLSEISILKDGLEVNGKSILGVLMLAAECGSEITIRATGPDEEATVEALESLIQAKFRIE